MLKGLMNLVKNVIMVIGVIAIMVFMADKAMDRAANYGIADMYTEEDCVYAEAVKHGIGLYTFKAEYVSDDGMRYSYEQDLNVVQWIINDIME